MKNHRKALQRYHRLRDYCESFFPHESEAPGTQRRISQREAGRIAEIRNQIFNVTSSSAIQITPRVSCRTFEQALDWTPMRIIPPLSYPCLRINVCQRACAAAIRCILQKAEATSIKGTLIAINIYLHYQRTRFDCSRSNKISFDR